MPGADVTREELEAALDALREPGRFDAAEQLVKAAAPGLLRILVEALAAGGLTGAEEAAQLEQALAPGGEETRVRLTALLSEHSRLGMLVGVAVGVELARELGLAESEPPLPVSHHVPDGGPTA